MQKIGFIGCGNIASAIINGTISSKVLKGADIFVFDVDPQKADPFIALGATFADSLKYLAEESDVLFLTIKPQILPTVLNDIAPFIKDDALIISPVAGVKTEKIQALLGKDKKIIRVMPNTPLMYSAGATALYCGEGVTQEEFLFAEKIFSSCGVTAKVTEDMMDTVTAISGSSPAFFMRFAKEIVNEGVRQGLSEEMAKLLVFQTMAGTAKMVMESENTVDQLIKAVTSPNGTTEAGLKKMDELDFDSSVGKTIIAAANRSKELSK